MGSSKILHIILILAFAVGNSFRFQLVGVFSFGWALAVAYTCLFLWRSPLLKEKDFRTASALYLAVIIVQIIAEYMAGNTLSNGMKGVAVNVVSFASFFFLSSFLCRNPKLILWLLLGQALHILILGADNEDFAEEGMAERALEGDNASFLKFYVAPFLMTVMLCISLFMRGKIATYWFMYFGVFLVLAGARSGGLSAFLVGFFVWIARSHKGTATSFIRKYSLPLLAVLYGVYAIYVSKVISGELTTGNNQQLAKSDNPYNPLEIIKYSRTDAWMGLVAWSDKPLWGHGSWQRDEDLKYHIMMSEITGGEYAYDSRDIPLIPGHSVIFGRAATSGIFGMISVTILIFFFVKRQYKLLDYDSRYAFINANYLFGTIWTSFFSPPTNLKNGMPILFAFTLALWLAYSKESQQQTALPRKSHPQSPSRGKRYALPDGQ